MIVVGDSTSRAIWGQAVQMIDGAPQEEWSHTETHLKRRVPCRSERNNKPCHLSVDALYWPPLIEETPAPTSTRQPLFHAKHAPLEQLNSLWNGRMACNTAMLGEHHHQQPCRTTFFLGSLGYDSKFVSTVTQWLEWKLLEPSARRVAGNNNALSYNQTQLLLASEAVPLEGHNLVVFRSPSPRKVNAQSMDTQAESAKQMARDVKQARVRIAAALRRFTLRKRSSSSAPQRRSLTIEVVYFDLWSKLSDKTDIFRIDDSKCNCHWHNPFGRIEGPKGGETGIYGALNYELTKDWLRLVCAA